MDWFRVKNCHVMYEGHTKTTLWAWIRVMSLTAQLEKMPTDEQIMAVITKKEYQCMLNHFSKLGKSVPEVLSKLLEDCTKVIEDRERLKDYRKNKKHTAIDKNDNSYTYGTSTKHVANDVDKIREDKIREDKNIVSFVPKDFQLSNCRTITSLITYIQKKDDIPADQKKNITIAVQSAAKQPHEIWELWELIEIMIENKQEGEKNVYRRKTSADQTVDAVNRYLESIGQVGNFGQISRSSDIEGDITKRLPVGSVDKGN